MSKKVAILASNGGIFDAYKVFNIAAASAAMDAQVTIFFTFEGVHLIHKGFYDHLPIPEGKESMEEVLGNGKVPLIPDLVEMVKDLGVEMMVCQMTMDLLTINSEDLVAGAEPAGAVTFLDVAFDADLTFSF